MSRQLYDSFFKKAKSEGYLARSAYKLLEIQKKHKVIPPGGNVLDLGCSPGAWLQVASETTFGQIVGIDLQACQRPAGLNRKQVTVLQADAQRLTRVDLLSTCQGFHAVLSDLCHATIGNAAADAARSLALGTCAAEIALGNFAAEEGTALESRSDLEEGVLLAGGNLVIKLLEGPGIQEFAQQLRPAFAKLRHVRPQATRHESREIYLVGLGRKEK